MKYFVFTYRCGCHSGIHYCLAEDETAALRRVRSRLHQRWPFRKVDITLQSVEAA